MVEASGAGPLWPRGAILVWKVASGEGWLAEVEGVGWSLCVAGMGWWGTRSLW